MGRDLKKEQLYEAVKTLVECEAAHIHLPQQKLFTLSSIAFQYLLFSSTKKPGHYIIRVEDSYLAEKLARKSKDSNTRKFMQRMLIPRRLKFNQSMFHLDYFKPSTWGKTCELPPEKICAALIIKNTSQAPMDITPEESEPVNHNHQDGLKSNGTDEGNTLYLTTLVESLPKTLTIAYGETFEGLHPISFDFILKENITSIPGVRFAQGLELED